LKTNHLATLLRPRRGSMEKVGLNDLIPTWKKKNEVNIGEGK
jgi:hypothetical protein